MWKANIAYYYERREMNAMKRKTKCICTIFQKDRNSKNLMWYTNFRSSCKYYITKNKPILYLFLVLKDFLFSFRLPLEIYQRLLCFFVLFLSQQYFTFNPLKFLVLFLARLPFSCFVCFLTENLIPYSCRWLWFSLFSFFFVCYYLQSSDC